MRCMNEKLIKIMDPIKYIGKNEFKKKNKNLKLNTAYISL